MKKIWLKNYPKGVPEEINPDAIKSLAALLANSVSKFGERPAFTNMDTTITFNQLDQLSSNFASYLQNHLKLESGSRVALMMPNLLQYPIALFGILKAGMVVVNVNPLYTARELKHQLNDSGTETIVIIENFASTLASVINETKVNQVVTTRIGDMLKFPKGVITNFVLKRVKKIIPAFDLPGAIGFKAALKLGSQQSLKEVEVKGTDAAFLQYTGGTTGVAKGAELTHRNIIANMMQTKEWLAHKMEPGNETMATALPLYHIFALTANCMTFTMLGGRNILITNPRDMPGFVKELSKYPISAMTGVNTLFNGLLNTPGFAELDFSSLKMTIGGGMAVQRTVAENWKQVTGCTLIEAYGLTETSPSATANPMDLKAYNGSIGLPMPSTEIKIIDDDDNEVEIGERGELCIKGPQVMRGYWNRPEATAESIVDGWLKTGDIAVVDEEGYVRIVDRKKDMILVSGFNVFPNEIEDVISSHPGILEIAAIGIPNEKSGEIVKVFIVKKDPNLTEEDVRAYCKENLTGYKCPRKVEFRDDLPKSNVGKILRKDLRAEEEQKNKPI